MGTILFLLLTLWALGSSPVGAQQRTYLVPQPGEIAESVRNLMERTAFRGQEEFTLDLSRVPMSAISQAMTVSSQATTRGMSTNDPAAFIQLGLMLGIGATVTGPLMHTALAYVWLGQAAELLPPGAERAQILATKNAIDVLIPPSLQEQAEGVVPSYLRAQQF